MRERIAHGLLHLACRTLEFKVQRELGRSGVLPQLHHGQGIEIRAEIKGSGTGHRPLAKMVVKHDGMVGTTVQRRIGDRTRIGLQKDIRKFQSRHSTTTSSFSGRYFSIQQNNCTKPTSIIIVVQFRRFPDRPRPNPRQRCRGGRKRRRSLSRITADQGISRRYSA